MATEMGKANAALTASVAGVTVGFIGIPGEGARQPHALDARRGTVITLVEEDVDYK
jgi:hypothetical protein